MGGADERPEFLRQSHDIAAAWDERGARMNVVEEVGHHHFNVIDGLTDPSSKIMACALGDETN